MSDTSTLQSPIAAGGMCARQRSDERPLLETQRLRSHGDRRGVRTQITSVVAGALWEWPPAVCGYHRDVESRSARSKAWCRASLQIFDGTVVKAGGDGRLRQAGDVLLQAADLRNAYHLAKMEELKHEVGGFRHDRAPNRAKRRQLRRSEDAYAHLAPMVDTDVYMAWLIREMRKAGCALSIGRSAGPL